MRRSQDNHEEKRTVRKGGKAKASRNEARNPQGQPEDKERERATRKDESTSSSMGLVMTEDELRARVSRKAYELYEKRRAITDVEDWLEAERLVKLQLLTEGQWAGSV